MSELLLPPIEQSADDVQMAQRPEIVLVEELTERQQSASFWVGKVASKGEILDEEHFEALSKFRAEVYVHELEFLPEEVLDDSGRELDEDDGRSINFAVVEKANEKVVGSGRIIMKDTETPVLPIEHYFPELFEENPIKIGSAEISRFIAKHEDKLTQHKISLSVIRAMTYGLLNNGVEEAYCIIEKPLVDMLSYIGIPMEVLAEPKDVPEYGGTLYPIKIAANEILSSVKTDKSGKLGLGPFFTAEAENQGLGNYPDSFMSERE